MEDEWETTNPEEEKIASEQRSNTAPSWTLTSPRTPIFRTRRDSAAGGVAASTGSGATDHAPPTAPTAHQQRPYYHSATTGNYGHPAPYWAPYPPPPYPGQDASSTYGPPPSSVPYHAPPGHAQHGPAPTGHPERVTPPGRGLGSTPLPPSSLPGPYSPIRQRPGQPQVTPAPHHPSSGVTGGDQPPSRTPPTTSMSSYPYPPPPQQAAYAYPPLPYAYPPPHGHPSSSYPPPTTSASYSATEQRQQPPPSYIGGVTPPDSHSRATGAPLSYGESGRYPVATASAHAPEYSPYYTSSGAYPTGEAPRVSYDTNSGTPSPAGPPHEHHLRSAAPPQLEQVAATAGNASRQPPPDYVYLPNTGVPPPPHHPYYHGYSSPAMPLHPSYPPHHYPPYASSSAQYPPAAGASMDDGAEEHHGELVYTLQEHDVLCGRGAPTTYHPGNQYFKELVNKWQPKYIASRRSDKPQIATKIVEIIRGRGGRFLKRTKRPGLGPTGHFCWEDVGEQRAYEKACQALRENAPEIRKRIAAEEEVTTAGGVSVDSNSEREHGTSQATVTTEQDDSIPLLRQASTMEDDRTLSSSIRKRSSHDEEDDDDDTTLQSRGDGRAEELSRSKRHKPSSSPS